MAFPGWPTFHGWWGFNGPAIKSSTGQHDGHLCSRASLWCWLRFCLAAWHFPPYSPASSSSFPQPSSLINTLKWASPSPCWPPRDHNLQGHRGKQCCPCALFGLYLRWSSHLSSSDVKASRQWQLILPPSLKCQAADLISRSQSLYLEEITGCGPWNHLSGMRQVRAPSPKVVGGAA